MTSLVTRFAIHLYLCVFCVMLLPTFAKAKAVKWPKAVKVKKGAQASSIPLVASVHNRQKTEQAGGSKDIKKAEKVQEKNSSVSRPKMGVERGSSSGKRSCPHGKTAVFSVQDALNWGNTHNVSLVTARNNVNLSAEGINQVRGEWLPTVSARVSARFAQSEKIVDRRAPIALTSGARLADRQEVMYKQKDFQAVDPRAILSVDQSLYSGGERASKLTGAQSRFYAATHALQKTEQHVFSNIMRLYVSVASSYEEWSMLKKREKVLWKLNDYAVLRYEVGDQRMVDMTLASSRAHKVTQEVNTAYQKFEIARNKLKSYVGRHIPYHLSFPDFEKNTLSLSMDAFVKLALDCNPELKESGYLLAAARAGIGIAQSHLKPKVDLSASLDYDRNRNHLRASNRDWSSFNKSRGVSRSIDLNMRWNLFTGGRAQSGCRSAELKVHSSRLKYEEVRRSIVQKAKSSYLEYKTAMKNLSIVRESCRQNLAALKAANDEYLTGNTSMLDLLGIEQQYSLGLFYFVRALSECVIAYYDCQSLIGRMDAHHLGLNTKIFDPEQYQKQSSYSFFSVGNASKMPLFTDDKDAGCFAEHDEFVEPSCANCHRAILDKDLEIESLSLGVEDKGVQS